jgi:hypothetical protein
MRKLFLSLGVVLAALIVAPAAEAHHLDQDTSTIVCVLTNNAPAVQVSAHYVDFSYWDQPVYRVTKIDGVIVPEGSGEIPRWNGPDYYDRISLPVAPGQHDVNYQSSWNQGDNGGYISRRVNCPTPVPPQPPPVLCNGVPMPPGTNCAPPPPVTIYYDCAGHQLLAGSPPATCPPPKPPKPPCGCKQKLRPKPKFHCPTIRLVQPGPRTPPNMHGKHRFGGRCSNPKAKIVSTMMMITAVPPGRPPIGSPTARVHWRGGIKWIGLYNLHVFRHHLAWGAYRGKYVFTIRYHGRFYKCVKHFRLMNTDPVPDRHGR